MPGGGHYQSRLTMTTLCFDCVCVCVWWWWWWWWWWWGNIWLDLYLSGEMQLAAGGMWAGNKAHHLILFNVLAGEYVQHITWYVWGDVLMSGTIYTLCVSGGHSIRPGTACVCMDERVTGGLWHGADCSCLGPVVIKWMGRSNFMSGCMYYKRE